MAKRPTPQGISALLGRAGFRRSLSSESGIKGGTDPREGYEVRKHPDRDGVVYVKQQPSPHYRRVQVQRRERKNLNAYAEVIEAAGFKVQWDHVDSFTSLIVSINEQPDAE
jgi:hypothetical protein